MTVMSLITAFQFLTIVPIKTRRSASDDDLRNSSAFFSLVGAAQGLVLALAAFLLVKLFSPHLTALLILAAYLFLTGGFHQDGLSDTFDALSVKSSGDRNKDIDKRLAIMKDSTVGPIGVIAIVFTLLLKYVLIKDLPGTYAYPDMYLVLFLMPLVSKWGMVVMMYGAKAARKDGMARIFLEQTSHKQLGVATLLLIAVVGGAVFAWAYLAPAPVIPAVSRFTLFFISVVAIVILFSSFLKHIFMKKFGGLTGDNFGALHEISEVAFLAVALLWK